MTASLPRLLVVTDEPISPLMGEMAARAWEFAALLGHAFPTTLAAPLPVPLNAPGFALAGIPPASEGYAALTELIRAHEIIVAQALPLPALPAEEMAAKYLVVDLCRPTILAHLAAHHHHDREGEDEADGLARELIAVNGLLAAGDFFLCPGEPQRTFWLGALAHAGRLTEAVYARAEDGRALIDVVPFGIPTVPPQKRGKVLKGAIPGIAPNDFVALWAGGADPLTLVHATARLRDVDYPIRTVFLEARQPGATPLDAARQRGEELGLTDTHLFFPEGAVPYGERAEYLLEADASISLVMPTLDVRLGSRPHILDALWAGIVPVVSDGDPTADLLRAYDAGRIVPPGDDAALAVTLANMIDNPYERRLLAARGHMLGQSFTWDAVAQPLLAYCRQPAKGARVPGFIAADLQERVNELERTLYQTSTYAERLERELAERGGPNLAAPPGERGIGSRLRRTMTDIWHGRPDPDEPPPDESNPVTRPPN
jgi:glycosyltransferase involved in cell wall biosynthesis